MTSGTLALASASGNASNYSIGTITLTVTQRPVNVDLEKTYDATTNVAAGDLKTNGIANTVLGHSLTLSGIGSMTTTGVGSGKSVSVGTLSISGAQSSNYTLTGGNHTIDVNPRTVNASGTRFYDGTTAADASAFDTFSNAVGSDTITLSGSGSIATASIGSKGVIIGSLQSAHPNYILGNANLTVSKRPVSLTGSRILGGTANVLSSELSIINLAGSETLTLSGTGTISDLKVGSHPLNLFTLVLSNGTGLVSNYTFTGGSFVFSILSPLPPPNSRAGVLLALKSMKNGNNRKLLPSKTSHRNVPAVSESFSISTPDQSVTINPCVLQSGYCD